MSEEWDRRKGERANAHAAFGSYLDMGVARSITKLSSLLNAPRSTLASWSRRWDWVARADAYDRWVEESARAQNRERLLAGRRHAAALGERSLRLVSERLSRLAPEEVPVSQLLPIAVKAYALLCAAVGADDGLSSETGVSVHVNFVSPQLAEGNSDHES